MAKLNINDGVRAFRENSNAVLLDVRTKDEYGEGHIDNSINIPLQSLEDIQLQIEDKNTPIYVYCHSGVRSAKSVVKLRQMGYNDVIDIGGIKDYNNDIKNT